MSTAVAGVEAPKVGVIDISGTARTPFGRLVGVEIRKMFDTRAGFWLMLCTGLLILLAMAIPVLVVGLNDGVEISATIFATQIMTVPLSLLLPVFPIVAVTSEWGQRTGLTTFVLEPVRLRVVAAKFVAVLALAVATLVLAAVLGAIGTALAGAVGGYSPDWSLSGGMIGWTVVSQIAFFSMAFALGMLVLNSPGAIAFFYAVALIVPVVVYAPLQAFFGWARDVIPFIDMNSALAPLLADEPTRGIDVAHVGTSVALWVILPLVLGTYRVLRSEVK